MAAKKSTKRRTTPNFIVRTPSTGKSVLESVGLTKLQVNELRAIAKKHKVDLNEIPASVFLKGHNRIALEIRNRSKTKQ